MPVGWTRLIQGLAVVLAKLILSMTSSPIYDLAVEIRHTVRQAVCRCRVMSSERYALWLGTPFGGPPPAFNIALCTSVLS